MTDAPVIASADEAPALPILIVPHPVLKAKARKVLPADREAVQALIPRMFTTMYKAPGIGLAAPQIGVSLRLAVIDLMLDDKRAPVVLINPEIIAASDELATREEGCLSIPGLYADVTRPAQVKVRYEDAAGMRQEITHLDGVLFVDHISALKRNMILRKLAKEQRLKAK